MKTKKNRNRNLPNPVARGYPCGYEPAFKRSVILYAEQKNNQEARKRFGITEETIRRWRKQRKEIMEKAQQCIRRSQRHTGGHGSFSESVSPAKEQSVEKEEELKKDIDSMPLQQRLSQNHNETSIYPEESLLQSLPLSPTKLKVTRQSKPHQLPPREPTPPPAPLRVCLKWNSHHTNMQSTFPSLLTREQYVDATLVSEGKTLKCHRMILSSCSPYFEEILNGIGPLQHPVLFMKDVPFWVLTALCDFMYAGEVHIVQDKLEELLSVAKTLKIKGLGGSTDNQDVQPVVPEIKQEFDPPTLPEKPVKAEKEEEPPPPSPKPTRQKKDERRSRYSVHAPKEECPPKVVPKISSRVVAKVVIPKLPLIPVKATVKNVLRNVVKQVPKPSTSKVTYTREIWTRKSEKHRLEAAVQKEKEKVPLKKDNINDPLDLLQPVYEEIAKDDPPQASKNASPSKVKEKANVPVKKTVTRKVKKRRYADYEEDREESPPPLFQSRKGTRSRPNVKIPKYFHAHYDDSLKETIDATIVREPHTDQNDPLIGVEVAEIKAEPLDLEENPIDMDFMVQDEGEEIIGNYDSPLVNIKIEPKTNTPNVFKKVLSPQPTIMDIRSSGLLNIKGENVQIVDISTISTGISRIDAEIERPPENPSPIIISSVQSMAELPEETIPKPKDNEPESESERKSDTSEKVLSENFANVVLTSPPNEADPLANPEVPQEREAPATPPNSGHDMETDELTINIKMENIKSETCDQCDINEVVNSETSKPNQNQDENRENEKSNGNPATNEGKNEDEDGKSSLDKLADQASTNGNCIMNETLGGNSKAQNENTVSDMTENRLNNVNSEGSGIVGSFEEPKTALEHENIAPIQIETAGNSSGSSETRIEMLVVDSQDSSGGDIRLEKVVPNDGDSPTSVDETRDMLGNDETEPSATENSVKEESVEDKELATTSQRQTEEDFTKDIELDDFMGGNGPSNYLGIDFSEDFDMEDKMDVLNDMIRESAEIDTEYYDKMEFGLSGDETDVVSRCVDDAKTTDENNIQLYCSKQNNVDASEEEAQEAIETKSLRTSEEDERKMEESLLADLDEDIVMAGTNTNREDDESTETTLEMIVNDLNKSLGNISE